MHWFATFLFLFGLGCLMVLPLVRFRELGKGFYAFVFTLSVILLGGGVLVGSVRMPDEWFSPPLMGRAETSPFFKGAYPLTTAFLLGAAMVTMILGHWYLLNACLSFAPLVRLSKALIVAIILKIACVAVLSPSLAKRGFEENALFSLDQLLIIVRLGAGLLCPLVFAIMVLKCAQIRSNQSATGILYALNIFVLMGELSSAYLILETGIWI